MKILAQRVCSTVAKCWKSIELDHDEGGVNKLLVSDSVNLVF